MSVRRTVARIRRRAGRAAWRVALGRVGGSVPRRYIRSLVEKAGTEAVAAHLSSLAVLAPAHVEHYDLDPDLPAEFRRSKAFDDRHVYRLRDVCVSPRTGLCWLPGGPILEESNGSLIRLLGWGATALDDPLLRVRSRIERTVVPLPGDGYFHWLLEALPAALHALEWAPDATLLLPRKPPRYVDEAVELLGIDNVERSDEPVRAGELILAARDPFSGFVPREDTEIVRRVFRPEPSRGAGEAVYVSRRFDPRAPANEADLERELARLDVRIVNPERLSLGEQIELFTEARIVAGSHGAGLANIVWSDASRLAEVFVADHFNDCYARLAVSLGATYRPFYCSTPPAPFGIAPVEAISALMRSAMLELEATE